MKTLPLLCILASSWVQGDVLPEPNVVMQSVVLGKKNDPEDDSSGDDCRGYGGYNNMIMRRIFHGLYPHSTRYKRDDNSYDSADTFEEKTMDRLLETLEELKEGSEKNAYHRDVKEREEDIRKSRLDQICRRGGSWHKLKNEECHSRRKKGDMDSFRRGSKDNYEDYLAENKENERRSKRPNYRKREWKEDLERRRLKESLADSWPRISEDRLPDDLFFPLPYHHQPSHQRYSTYLP